MRINPYVDARLERWACWRAGSNVSVAPWARLRYGTPPEQTDPPPRDEERETEQIVQLLTVGEREFLMRMYPTHSRAALQVAKAVGCSISTIYSTLARIHAVLLRMIDQRRKGEEIDPRRKPVRSKAIRVKVDPEPGKKRGRTIASVPTA